MNWLELTGVALGVLYLYWEYHASTWLWIASIAMPAIYLGVYYDAGLYADFGINIYYIIASIYGLICWLSSRNHKTKDDEPREDAKITNTPCKLYLPMTAAFVIIFIVLGFILSRFTDSTVPWADSFTTSLSIVAMWMLAKKYLEQWLVWIAADIGCSILYAYKGLWLTGCLYLAYAVVAIFGYIKWKRLMKNEHNI